MLGRALELAVANGCLLGKVTHNVASSVVAAVITLEFVWHVQIGCLFILSITVPKVHPLERRWLGTEMFLHIAAKTAIHPPSHEL